MKLNSIATSGNIHKNTLLEDFFSFNIISNTTSGKLNSKSVLIHIHASISNNSSLIIYSRAELNKARNIRHTLGYELGVMFLIFAVSDG